MTSRCCEVSTFCVGGSFKTEEKGAAVVKSSVKEKILVRETCKRKTRKRQEPSDKQMGSKEVGGQTKGVKCEAMNVVD